jgi:hypothetical protein
MKTKPALFRLRDEHGQILVIFAGGLVALLAITALVVDLGFVFMLRRQEQNAADPGAIAAARFIPTADQGKMWDAACFYASQNGFLPRRTDTNNLCVPGQTDGSTLTVNYPPSKNVVGFAGNPKYVEVVVASPHDSFFAGVIGLPKITVVTNAVAAFDDGTAGVSSLVGVNPSACSPAGARLHGGGSGGGVYIFPADATVPVNSGGYVQVNSDCGTEFGANNDCSDGNKGGLTIVGGSTIKSKTICIRGACRLSGGTATLECPPGVVPCVDELATYVGDPLSLIRSPSPGDLPTQPCPTGASGTPAAPKKCKLNGTIDLPAGTYYGGWQVNGASTKITLEAGIYILAGGGLTQTVGSTVAAASGRVLIFSTDAPICGHAGATADSCQDDIDFGGTTSLNLRGLDRNTPCLPYGASQCPYGGLLLWQDANASGSKNILLEGSGSLYLEGTIYDAGGDVTITGNSVTTGCTPDAFGNTDCAAVQVISDTWDIGGAGLLNMPYDPKLFYHQALKGLVK